MCTFTCSTMEWQQKKRWTWGYILISVHFSSNPSEIQETTCSLLHHSSRYWNSNETHDGAVNHEGPAHRYPHPWLKQKLKTTKERYNRERKHHNVRKTSGIVIPPETDRAGLVSHIWHELKLFHSQFSFRPTQGKTSPNLWTHACNGAQKRCKQKSRHCWSDTKFASCISTPPLRKKKALKQSKEVKCGTMTDSLNAKGDLLTGLGFFLFLFYETPYLKRY